ncbi:hypothetical protein Y023_5588 [Burkholderia pseudomallei A79D]|nr:hypothetical protein Y023_5588 [Burkholderia pseudomallei A79D]KGX95703.1 hypothetical protein X997_5373 [Burkholderia pseudomallei A79C]
MREARGALSTQPLHVFRFHRRPPLLARLDRIHFVFDRRHRAFGDGPCFVRQEIGIGGLVLGRQHHVANHRLQFRRIPRQAALRSNLDVMHDFSVLLGRQRQAAEGAFRVGSNHDVFSGLGGFSVALWVGWRG